MRPLVPDENNGESDSSPAETDTPTEDGASSQQAIESDECGAESAKGGQVESTDVEQKQSATAESGDNDGIDTTASNDSSETTQDTESAEDTEEDADEYPDYNL